MTEGRAAIENALRSLPSVDRVMAKLQHLGVPRDLLAEEVRAVLMARRQAIEAQRPESLHPPEQEVEERLLRLKQSSLRSVINATGVILHTNLGRAPLARFDPIAGYSNLEYDLATGKRGKRDAHTAGLLERLLGRPALVVNNNAAAVFLVLHELAAGYEVIVSRGELIEIGDGFRIPEIMARSQAILREVGTTNRTSVEDYRSAMNAKTRLILRVHPSNFQIKGFTARPALEELVQLGLPVYEDLGSGCLVDLEGHGVDEPLVSDSLRSGLNVVSFSCDKLLGGPQSGIIAGDVELIARIRKNPMYRAFRCDKLIIQTMETALRCLLFKEWDAVPTLRMIFTSLQELQARALRVQEALGRLKPDIRESESPIGGGSTPDQALPTWLVAVKVEDATAFERRLRQGRVPVIARIERGYVLFDMRTVSNEEESVLVSAVFSAANA